MAEPVFTLHVPSFDAYKFVFKNIHADTLRAKTWHEALAETAEIRLL